MTGALQDDGTCFSPCVGCSVPSFGAECVADGSGSGEGGPWRL